MDEIGWTKLPERLQAVCSDIDDRVCIVLEQPVTAYQSLVVLPAFAREAVACAYSGTLVCTMLEYATD